MAWMAVVTTRLAVFTSCLPAEKGHDFRAMAASQAFKPVMPWIYSGVLWLYKGLQQHPSGADRLGLVACGRNGAAVGG